MPTPTGLPKAGEKWEFSQNLPMNDGSGNWETTRVVVTVVERGTGSYWSLRVKGPDGQVRLWVDASYHFSKGQLKLVK